MSPEIPRRRIRLAKPCCAFGLSKLKVLHGRGGRAAVGATVGKKLQKKIAGVTEDPMEKVEGKAGDVQATVRRIAKG